MRGSSSSPGRGPYTAETSVQVWLLAPFSGPVAARTAASPCHQPRDWAPWYPTVRNIARTARNFHLATLSHNVSDWARHEYPLP